jgi:adenosylmethionine-8-amino-7-oxononanoate aminotransferase
MRDWLKQEPIIIGRGRGAVLQDVRGRQYLDANSSIWTNLHGHNHSKINAAIGKQLKKVAHSSALGFANEPASVLAARLVKAANGPERRAPALRDGNRFRGAEALRSKLEKVFFSDDGSTAMEVALKLAYEFARRSGRSKRPKFLSLAGAYHGDTIGAVALGHIDLFHKSYSGILFKTDRVMAPYCYRCPFNRAKPERADARAYRKCHWECVGKLEQKFKAQRKRGDPYAAFVVEPLIQGAAGMIPQPAGWLRQAAEIARGHGSLIIADEVMTGFGRTGVGVVRGKVGERVSENSHSPTRSLPHLPIPPLLFACQHEDVQPDFLALAKGLTGGYLPMGATVTTQEVFDAFLGQYDEFKTFFHGHSYTGNQLGSAAALASVDILQSPASVRERHRLENTLHEELKSIWRLPHVGDFRQVGLIVGIELVKNWRTREPYDLRERVGIRVCEKMAKHGVLTRPIGNVIVLMPPYCMTAAQVHRMVAATGEAIATVTGN